MIVNCKRFWQYAAIAKGCWLWQGSVSHDHARFSLRKAERCEFGYTPTRKTISAHLLAWRLVHGAHVKYVDRTCGNTLCVRPRHLIQRTTESRFLSKVEQGPECWLWMGALGTHGYGRIGRDGKTVTVHRYAYERAFGEIPARLVVRHSCHNRRCVRPAHLSIGTQADNIDDMVRSGRQAHGTRSGNAAFDMERILAVLRGHEKGLSINDLARIAGVHRNTIMTIVDGRRYKDVYRTQRIRQPGTPRNAPTNLERLAEIVVGR